MADDPRVSAVTDGIGPTDDDCTVKTLEQVLSHAFGPHWRQNPDWERVRAWVISEYQDQFDPPWD